MAISTVDQPFSCKTKLKLKNTPSSAYYSLWQNDTLTANATITVPNFTAITLARTNDAQTFAGLQSFGAGISITGGTTNNFLALQTGGTAATTKITLSGTTWQFGGPSSTFTEAGAATFATSVTTPTVTSAAGLSIQAAAANIINFAAGGGAAGASGNISATHAWTLGPSSSNATMHIINGHLVQTAVPTSGFYDAGASIRFIGNMSSSILSSVGAGVRGVMQLWSGGYLPTSTVTRAAKANESTTMFSLNAGVSDTTKVLSLFKYWVAASPYSHLENAELINNVELLSCTAAGAVTLGATQAQAISGVAHVLNGGLNNGATGSGAANKRMYFNCNTYETGVSTKIRDSHSSTVGGGCIELLAWNTGNDAQNCITFKANLAGDSSTTDATIVGGCAQTGAWTLGPATPASTIIHYAKGYYDGDGAFWAANYSTTSDSPGITCATANTSNTDAELIHFYINYPAGAAGQGMVKANGAGAAAFAAFSDRSLKENITPLTPQLASILALNPVEFDYKAGGHNVGFIAQDMQQIYPDSVSSSKDTLLLTGWDKTTARLVKAIQEQQAIILALQTRIEALETK